LTRLRLFAVALVALSLSTLAVAVADGVPAESWGLLIFLSLGAAVAEGRSIRVAPRVELSVSFIPLVFGAVLLGPAGAGIVGLAAMLGDRRGPVERFAIYAAARTLSGVAAGAAVFAVQGWLPGGELQHYLAASATAAAVSGLVDFAIVAATMALRALLRPAALWRLVRGSLAVSIALYTPLTALFAYAYVGSGKFVLAFFLIPVLAAHLSHAMHSRQVELIDELQTTNERLEDANTRLRRINLSFAAAMVRALDSRDAYTAGHSAAVAVYSRDIARELALPAEDVELIHLAGLVHDIGKIGLRAEVLQKQSALDDAEWAEMRRHSEIGARILVEVEDYGEIARIVRSHHERYDGAGYPDGLAGEAIPPLSRIIAVADAYNAMTSDRPYRRAMAPDVAMQQLVLGKGTQFEPALVDAFVAVLERESEPYRRGLQADFSLEAMQHAALTPVELPARRAIHRAAA
jgi:putative nucleotidyltransferase with HDIG domain